MEKINVAELLKDCPTGMELDCTIWDDVVFDHIDMNSDYPIYIKKMGGVKEGLTENGYFNFDLGAKCVIFPKGKTTWEGFIPHCKFKDGDIIFTHANCLKVGLGNTWISIFQEKRNGGVATYVDYDEDGDGFYSYNEDKGLLCMEEDIMRQRFATEEEKAKLFQAIKEHGFKWNAETKTLEKLVEPIFKVGDRIRHKEKTKWTCMIKRIDDVRYWVDKHPICFTLPFGEQDEYELVPNKFDITTLKPFESRVLVRDNNTQTWKPAYWGFYDKTNNVNYPYIIVGGGLYGMSIPYENNEHLLGTTDDCDEFYKTWE